MSQISVPAGSDISLALIFLRLCFYNRQNIKESIGWLSFCLKMPQGSKHFIVSQKRQAIKRGLLIILFTIKLALFGR